MRARRRPDVLFRQLQAVAVPGRRGGRAGTGLGASPGWERLPPERSVRAWPAVSQCGPGILKEKESEDKGNVELRVCFFFVSPVWKGMEDVQCTCT